MREKNSTGHWLFDDGIEKKGQNLQSGDEQKRPEAKH